MNSAVQLSFWLTLALLFYTFAGYALLMSALAWLRDLPSPISHLPSPNPTLTIILAAHNESARLIPRLENLLASDYPAEKFQIILADDGSTDDTAQQIKNFAHPRVHYLPAPQRHGKAHALNRAAAAATTDLLVFADVRQRFAPDALAQLARHFGDLETGAVSGELLIETAASSTGSGVDFYWKLEKILRHAEARWDSAIGCTGAIYAIRRELFQPIPADTILDDVVIPMQLAVRGFRVGFDPAARAYDPQTLEPAREQIRKRRTLAGNYQMLFRHPVWLLPWRNRLWWQLLSHKYLRLAAPFLLTLLLLANFLLVGKTFFTLAFTAQIIFYTLAFVGLKFPEKKSRVLSLPAGFVFLNWQAAVALWHYLRNPSQTGWQITQASC